MRKLILLGLAVLLAGVLYVGAYFYVKSGEPMTVAESQRLAPGLTFRDFWASRMVQWRLSDDEKEKAGARFLGGWGAVMRPGYPIKPWKPNWASSKIWSVG